MGWLVVAAGIGCTTFHRCAPAVIAARVIPRGFEVVKGGGGSAADPQAPAGGQQGPALEPLSRAPASTVALLVLGPVLKRRQNFNPHGHRDAHVPSVLRLLHPLSPSPVLCTPASVCARSHLPPPHTQHTHTHGLSLSF